MCRSTAYPVTCRRHANSGTLPTLEFGRAKHGARLVPGFSSGPAQRPNPIQNTAFVRWRRTRGCSALGGVRGGLRGRMRKRNHALANGTVSLVENVRYHAEEEANDEGFRANWLRCATEMFVCDAFRFGPSRACFGSGAAGSVKQAVAGAADGAGTGLPRTGAFSSRAAIRRRAGPRARSRT